MAGIGVGALGGAGAVLAAEVCAPLLLLCWLCCWPDDDRSDSSSGKYQPQKPVISDESCRRGASGFGSRRFGSSAVSLHLPSTSGQSKLSAHRSHEEIRSKRHRGGEAKSGEGSDSARYHSAPSVIDEVVHRRDWERSTAELHIPLRGSGEEEGGSSGAAGFGPCSFPETRQCKKHYMNIKSSRKKEVQDGDDKDRDVTEGDVSIPKNETEDTSAAGSTTNFYIGDSSLSPNENDNDRMECRKTLRAKEAKQSLNESIRCKGQRQPLIPLTEFQVAGFDNADYIDDRSGAVHHSVESRFTSFSPRSVPGPPPSVEAVGYSFDSYHEESGAVGVWRAPDCRRSRHASAGDVLAAAVRPQSGALSESELDWELEEIEVTGKETAI